MLDNTLDVVSGGLGGGLGMVLRSAADQLWNLANCLTFLSLSVLLICHLMSTICQAISSADFMLILLFLPYTHSHMHMCTYMYAHAYTVHHSPTHKYVQTHPHEHRCAPLQPSELYLVEALPLASLGLPISPLLPACLNLNGSHTQDFLPFPCHVWVVCSSVSYVFTFS